MSSRRHVWIGLTAAIMSLLLVYAVYKLQLKQIEMQEHVLVVVPKQFIGAGTLLAAEHLQYKPVMAGAYEPGMFRSIQEVAGLENMVPLGMGEPVLSWKVGKFALLPREGESTFQIPRDYILSLSSGIRAGDRVRLYVSAADGQSRRLFAEDVVVASVKSSANAEIDNVRQPNLVSRLHDDKEAMYASRRDANGMIDQINLNLTEQQWLEIDVLCQPKTAKLVIAFTPFSITGANETEQGGWSG